MPAKQLRNYNGLTVKEQLYCDEYLKTLDTRKAALAAGYSESSARTKASEIFKRPQVQNYLQTITKSIERETIANTAEVRELLTRIIRGEEQVEELVNVFQGGGVQELIHENRPPNNREKLDAAEKLLRVSGAYKADVNNVVAPIIKIDI